MGEPGDHIAQWQAAGLIDQATAERLRSATVTQARTATDLAASTSESSQVAAMFGPSVTIPEVFGYLGTAFLLAGWTAFVTRTTFWAGNTALGPGIGGVIASVGLVALGTILRRGDDARRTRSAGVAFLVAVAYAGGGFGSLASSVGLSASQAAVIGAGVAFAVAIGLRGTFPTVLTQIGLLGAITALAGTILAWFESVVVPNQFNDDGTFFRGGPDPLVLASASAIWWLACAVLIGLIGLTEARAAERGDVAAGRRAAVTRFWAGLVAVIGLAMTVTRSGPLPNGDYGRVMKAWVGDLGILAVSAGLLERAFRRDATSYVYAAALGLIVALSDFNATYLSQTSELGLVIEGAILLGVGLAADRLRRRVGRRNDGSDTEAGISEVVVRPADSTEGSTTEASVPTTPIEPLIGEALSGPVDQQHDRPPTQPPDRPQSGARR